MMIRRTLLTVMGVLAISLSVAQSALAQSAEAEAETVEELTATIDKIEGSVDVQLSEAADWAAAEEKMVLQKGAKISTGPLGRAWLLLASGEGNPSLVIVKALTILIIDEHLKTATTVRTKLSLKIGALYAAVPPTRLETDFRISTPVLTASVRGSEWKDMRHFPDSSTDVQSGDLDPEHSMEVEDEKGRKRKLGSNQRTDEDLLHPVDAEKEDRTEVTPPEGSTDDERDWARWLPDPTDDNPGDENDRDVHPENDRIVEQESHPTEPHKEEPETPPDGGEVVAR